MELPFDSPGPSGSRLTVMVCLSLLIHGGLIGLMLLSPSFPTPKRTFGPAYSVALVSAPGSALEQKSVATAAKELLAAHTPQPATVLKKQLALPPVVPLRSLQARPKSDPGLEKAMAEIRKRAAADGAAHQGKTTTAQESRVAQAAAAAQAAGRQTAAAGQGVAAGGGADGKLEAYYALLWSRIRGQWALPPGILSGEPLEAVIGIAMLRNGAVTALHFEKRSGNRYFDDSALKAIEKATPLPPLPDGIGGKSLELGVRFHSAELKR